MYWMMMHDMHIYIAYMIFETSMERRLNQLWKTIMAGHPRTKAIMLHDVETYTSGHLEIVLSCIHVY